MWQDLSALSQVCDAKKHVTKGQATSECDKQPTNVILKVVKTLGDTRLYFVTHRIFCM